MTHTVLLVDDDANLLLGLRRALREQPYALYTARSGEDALYMFKVRKIDLIVVDERMPGMSGGDVLAWVAKHYPETVRMVLTGHATAESAIRAINEGSVYHFFTKPCNDAHLAVAICKALQHKDLLQEHSRLLEINRQQSQDLERFNRDLEILASTVVQDVEKPLGLIAQSCRSLAENYQDVFDPKTASLTRDALDAVGEVQRLLLKLLDYTRSSSLPGSPQESGADAGSSAGLAAVEAMLSL